MAEPLPETEPVVVITNGEGAHLAVPASVAAGVAASLRKFQLMKGGLTSDEAEAALEREREAGAA